MSGRCHQWAWAVVGLAVAAAVAVDAARAATPGRRELTRAEQLYQDGLEKEKKGDVPGARADFLEALRVYPDYGAPQLELGKLLLAEKRFPEAIEALKKAEAIFVRTADQRHKAAMKNYQDAQREIVQQQEQIRNLQIPGPITNKMNETQVTTEINTRQDRIKQLQAIPPPSERGYQKAPGDLYFFLGNAYLREDRMDEALAAWETCRDLMPDFPAVYNNLAFAYWKRGRVEEARTALARAEELGAPVNPEFKAKLDQAAGR
ncbi:MAG: tetratricopeptide repeat protein [Acidobacteria bacterium]|jgi:tetratricopeptide (TPR) repeat protein|nr:tetratricopeptide repeat protein [Acidobacteriota bacterium]